MRHTKYKLLFLAALLMIGCSTTSKVTVAGETWEDLRDVFILTMMVQDYLKATNGNDFNLENLHAYDSSGRISKNFATIKQISRSGHIAVQYKFSEHRNLKLDFTENERQRKENWKVVEQSGLGGFDGEIQFEYGENFYNFRKIVIEKP